MRRPRVREGSFYEATTSRQWKKEKEGEKEEEEEEMVEAEVEVALNSAKNED